jgi:rhodanese-related sulfurtransferase
VSTFSTLTTAEVAPRAGDFTIVDVRTPGEYAGGHLPGARNIPLDRLKGAAETLREAAGRSPLLLVCASGARSANGCAHLASLGIEASTLGGGTQAWAAAGHPLERPAGARSVWPMDRQVRLVAGSLVLLGFLVGLVWPPAHWLSGAIGAGLVFSGVTNTCGMAAVLGKLPYNKGGTDCPAVEEPRSRIAA